MNARILVLTFCTLVLPPRTGQSTEPEQGLPRLRVGMIRPSQFDFVLMSAFPGKDDRQVLGFNHRSGRTHFVGLGEALDGYTVVAYDATTQRVFNATLNAFQTHRSGTAVLEDENGERIELTMQRALPQPGWTAWLIDLDAAAAWCAKEGDVLHAREAQVHVAQVSSNHVTVVGPLGQTHELARPSDAEQQQLARLVAQRREQRQIPALEPDREVASQTTDAPGPIRPRRSGSSFSYSTTYRLPIEYKAVPVRTARDGRFLWHWTLVPVRFETRHTGVFIRVR